MDNILKGLYDGLKPPPNITVSEWADKYRFLPTTSSSEAGKYYTERTPYVKEIADELSPQSPTKKVVVVKGVQLAFTELANNIIFTYAHLYPCPMLFVLPTEVLALTHAKDKVWESVEATPILKKIIIPRKSENGSSLFNLRFRGGSITIGYAHTSSTFASVSRRIVILDDVDRFPQDVNGEGDPITLAEKRADAFPINKKIYLNSSPTTKKGSRIWREYMDGSQATFYIPCPNCGEFIALEKENFKYKTNEYGYIIGGVRYKCYLCNKQFTENKKLPAMKRGKWIHKYPEREIKSYRLPSYYSVFLSWYDIFTEYERAKSDFLTGNERKLIVWTNTRDANIWDFEEAKKSNIDLLKLRIFITSPFVPDDTIKLTMAVDVQKDHFYFMILAWRKFGNCHIVRYGSVLDWEDLEKIMVSDYYYLSNTPIYISKVAIDAGYRTDEVLEFSRLHNAVCVPMVGRAMTQLTAPFKFNNWVRNKKPTGLKIYTINADYYKDIINSYITHSLELIDNDLDLLNNNEKRIITFNNEADETLQIHLTAEQLKEKRTQNGGIIYKWQLVDSQKRNHLLDCLVYNFALGDITEVRQFTKRAKKRPKRRVISKGLDYI